ncbi:MAG: TonB-dependent receptor [Gammaproteobacteria bacterium]|nr:TonB-dependent receptor [Gammaproteobacteria bacterium]
MPGALSAQHVTEEVVVTATPMNQSADELAQSVTVLGGAELDRLRAVTLGETLEGQLGISSTYFGAGASRPIIRGLAGARVRTMEDGIETLDVSTVSDDHAIGIDPLIARQIEIFRGPTTLLYGNGAVGGVVNTVTNRIPEAAPEDGFTGAVEVRGDTAADERTLSVALDGGGSRLAWHADAARRRTDDYRIPGAADVDAAPTGSSRLENSDLELASYSLGGSWSGQRGLVGIAVSRFDTEYGVPGHAHAEEGEGEPEAPVRIDLEQTRVDIKGSWLEFDGAIEGVNFRIGVNDYAHVELEGAEIGTRFENDAYEGRIELLHRPVGAWSGAFGLQISDRDFSAIGDEAFIPPVETSSAGAFVIERLELDRWDLAIGARYDERRHRPTNGDSTRDSALGLSAAAVRELSGGRSLALNWVTAERLPVAEELFANGPHLANAAIEIGDPTLGSETSRHFDIGLRKTTGMLRWSVTAFSTDYSDFIYLRDTGVVDPDEDLPVFMFSQQDARFRGIEAEVFTPIAQAGDGEIDLRLFTDFVDAELANGQNVPRIPPRRYGARLAYHATRYVVGLDATRYAAQNSIAPFETPTPGYTMVSADFDWSIDTAGMRDFSVFVRGTNLLDRDARRHSSLVKEFVPLPGRNLMVGVRASF